MFVKVMSHLRILPRNNRNYEYLHICNIFDTLKPKLFTNIIFSQLFANYKQIRCNNHKRVLT